MYWLATGPPFPPSSAELFFLIGLAVYRRRLNVAEVPGCYNMKQKR